MGNHLARLCCGVKENREKVALLLQLSDNLVEKGHTHTDNIKSWASLVDRRYNDFSMRMEKYRDKLMSTLGIPLDGSGVSSSVPPLTHAVSSMYTVIGIV